jgi:hypothetical protein
LGGNIIALGIDLLNVGSIWALRILGDPHGVTTCIIQVLDIKVCMVSSLKKQNCLRGSIIFLSQNIKCDSVISEIKDKERR